MKARWMVVAVALMGMEVMARAEVKVVDLMKETLEAAKSAGVDQAYVVREVVNLQARTGDLEGAKRAAEAAGWNATDVECLVASTKALSGDMEGAGKAVEGAEKKDQDRIWDRVTNSLAVRGKVQLAEEAFAKIESKGVRGIAAGDVAVAEAATGNVKRARELIPDVRFDRAKVYADAASALAMAGKKDDAREFITAAQRPAENMGDGVHPWRKIAKAEVLAGNTAEAKMTATSTEYEASEVWMGIADALMLQGKMKEARAAGQGITLPLNRSFYLVTLAKALKKAGDQAGAEEATSAAKDNVEKVKKADQGYSIGLYIYAETCVRGVEATLEQARKMEGKDRATALLAILNAMIEEKEEKERK